MKIPKSIKLPRKLKKEVKKGFNRNIKSGPPVMSSNPGVVSCSMYQTVSYSGSNTKSFRRLCKYARKEEKRVYEQMMYEQMINICITNSIAVENKSDSDMLTYNDLIEFSKSVFCKSIQKPIIGNVPDFWEDTTIQTADLDVYEVVKRFNRK